MNAADQKSFWIVLGCFGLLDLLSWMAGYYPIGITWITLAVLTGLLGLGLKWPWLPALVSVGELAVGGQGYLLWMNFGDTKISLRLGLFIILVVLSLWKLKTADVSTWLKKKPLWALLGWLLVMTVTGLVQGYGRSVVWLDVNGYLFIGTVITWFLLIRPWQPWRNWLIVTLLAGATYLGLKSWLMIYLFAHQPDNIDFIYRWVRNTGVGEITVIKPPLYRVFFQSQIYGVVVFLITWSAWILKRAPRWWWMPMIAGGFAAYISLSRSFWLGFGIAMIVLCVWSLIKLGGKVVRRWLLIIPVGLGVWLLANWGYYWPRLSPATGGGTNLVQTRLAADGSQDSSDARLNQLKPLWTAIKRAPLTGQGFGTQVTYYSTDPRIRGQHTTSAFEWGYLDQWLKFGLVGLALFAWWIWSIIRPLSRTSWWGIMAAATIALFVIHLTTPYLNHPLGLGWLAFLSLYATDS